MSRSPKNRKKNKLLQINIYHIIKNNDMMKMKTKNLTLYKNNELSSIIF